MEGRRKIPRLDETGVGKREREENKGMHTYIYLYEI